jgi:hypothetical protein
MLRRSNLLNKIGELINPATEEKQDSAISKLTESVDALNSILSSSTNGSQKTQLVDEAGNASHSTQDINGAWHTGTHVIQHSIKVDSNSSTSDIEPGEGNAFIGPAFDTTGGNLIGVMLHCDNNCTVHIDQSTDGANWDISDPYEFTDYVANFSAPAHVFGVSARVRVVNNGDSTTTEFRLLTLLQPIGTVLPRSLCRNGCLKVTVNSIADQHGFLVENTPTGEQRVANLSILVGAPFEGSSLDAKFWSNESLNGGSVAVSEGTATVSTGTTADGSQKLWSVRRNQYIPGTSCRFRAVAQFVAGATDNKMQLGLAYGVAMPTISDAALFSLHDNQFMLHLYKGGILTEITSYNGDLGTSYSPEENELLEYEIYFSAAAIYFAISGDLLHTYRPTDDRWAGTAEFHVYADSVNINGHSDEHNLKVHSAGISRFGKLSPQYVSDSQSGSIAAKTLKIGVGMLASLSVSGVANNSVVTLYDNTAASGTVLWTSGPMSAQSTPFDVNLNNIPFNIGLTLAITGANSNVTTVYA